MGPLLWLSYSKIYDEDESMMKTRQNQLDRITQATDVQESSKKFLGYYSQILLQLPLFFDLDDHTYGITLHRDKLLAYDGVCPHMLRPLHDVKVENGKIRCPWHGYEFSIENRSCSNRSFSLKPAPNIHIIDDKVFAAF
jgi:nitrite reductase/ring-hydroxylating ferredoxin subunit